MKYIKKPTVFEAMCLCSENWHEVCEFVGIGPEPKDPKGVVDPDSGEVAIDIPTLEGFITIKVGDWAVKTVFGRPYMKKDPLFDGDYEEYCGPTDIPYSYEEGR